MKVIIEKTILLLIFAALGFISTAQEIKLKKETTPSELELLKQVFKEISITDQLYRAPLSSETLDTILLAKIDSVFDNHGVEEGFQYRTSLNLSLSEKVKDSLWQLQHQIDFKNHQILRGIFSNYGFIPKEIIEEHNYVQILLLMHPPKDWDVTIYLEKYSKLLMPEVKAGRMPAKTYANFYDNMKAKILRLPQLYGTNKQFDPAEQKVLPPIIENLEKTNRARKEIGLPILKDGEYRLAKG